MFVSWGLAVTCGIDPVQAIAGFSKGFGDILSFVGIVILKGWIDKETMQRVRAIPNPLEKKIELTRVLGFPERVFTDPKGNHPGN
jgi:hypothetical protein